MIWKDKTPRTVQVFLWLLWQDRILKNEEWAKRHMIDNGHCPQCNNVNESIDTGFVWARRYDLTFSNLIHANPTATTMHWLPPKRGWTKLNMDGALPLYRSRASIGGVFRDADANWLCGFSLWIGNDTIFKVEARVVL
ncbi:hypothetical protein PVK06_039655 [Gossypium arboreum]|uniref:Reverse transcriptase zinc-binding domain-containing protein n=1 Tax=Gossypium arboreum TaxID=29729 RepID=A0ABR0N3I2_GOSAR|nr:hypothetical protein PVK06_039655 [Gossypium arboreum]